MPTTKAKKPLTPAEQRAQRLQELDWQQQMQLVHEQERAERQKESDEFMARAEAGRQARQAAIERGDYEPPVIPTLNGIYQAKAAEERAEDERLETERLAAIPARETLISTLPYAKQMAIQKWEATRKQQFPIEALPFL